MHNLFQKKRRKFSSLFYEAGAYSTQIEIMTLQKKNNTIDQYLMNIDVKILIKYHQIEFSNIKITICYDQVKFIPEMLDQLLKINQDNIPCQRTKEENHIVISNDAKNHLTKFNTHS